MSLTVSTDVFCDLCPNWVHGTTGVNRYPTKARQVAASRGWARKRIDGVLRDVCPQCHEATTDA